MAKHIIGQSIYQSIVLCIFLFIGPDFLPEEIDSDYEDVGNKILA